MPQAWSIGADEGPSSHWEILQTVLAGGVVRRSSELVAAGVTPTAIAAALRRGRLVRPLVGTYRLADGDTLPWKVDVAAACSRLPKAIVCMETAARLAGLLAAEDAPLWLAVSNSMQRNKLGPLPHRLLSWSWPGAFDLGVVTTEICGVPVKMTGPARTVVDLFRYSRHLLGQASAVSALRGLLKAGGRGGDVLELAEQTDAPAKAVERIALVLAAVGPERDRRRRHFRRPR